MIKGGSINHHHKVFFEGAIACRMRGDRVKNGARDCRGGIFGRERRDAAGRAAERTRGPEQVVTAG